jgi:hypothetical protein
VEDIFGLPHLAYAAQDGLNPFGTDVFNAAAGTPATSAAKPLRVKLSGAPRGCVRRPFRVRVKVTGTGYTGAQAKVDRRRVAQTRKSSFKVGVATKRLRPGRHRLMVRATATGGRTAAKTLRFRVCR